MELDLTITFGAIAPFMSDPTIEEIWINSPERIFIARNGRSELTNLLLSSDDVRNIVERALMWSGRRLDLSSICRCPFTRWQSFTCCYP